MQNKRFVGLCLAVLLLFAFPTLKASCSADSSARCEGSTEVRAHIRMPSSDSEPTSSVPLSPKTGDRGGGVPVPDAEASLPLLCTAAAYTCVSLAAAAFYKKKNKAE